MGKTEIKKVSITLDVPLDVAFTRKIQEYHKGVNSILVSNGKGIVTEEEFIKTLITWGLEAADKVLGPFS